MKITDPDTPYMLAQRELLERNGDYIKSAHQWRLAAFACLAVAIAACVGFGVVSSQQKVVPYIVEINGNSEVARVVRAEVAGQVNENQVKASLRNWIIGARTVHKDLFAEQHQIETAYSMTLPNSAAYQALMDFHKNNDPYDRAKKETVAVTVNAVFPTTAETWQAEWTETTMDLSGKVVSVRVWQGSFTVKIIPPTTDSQILVNPLGVYVIWFAWTNRQ